MVRIINNQKYDADVLVVGAGPAGASLAKYLVDNGHSVLMVDTSQFPRDKVCGDFVGPVAIQELVNLGVWASVNAFISPKNSVILAVSKTLPYEISINQ